MADHTGIESAPPSTVLKHLPDLVFEFTPDGIYIAFHGGPEELSFLGKAMQLIGSSIQEVLPEPAAHQLLETIKRVHADGQPRGVYIVLPQQGELHNYDCRVTRLASGNCLAVCRRITEAWRARAALQRSEEKFRALVHNLPGIVYRCLNDTNWTAIYLSETVTDILGHEIDEFFNGSHHLANSIYPEDRATVQRAMLDAIERREAYDLTYRMVTKEGELRYVHERGRPVFDSSGQGVFLDGVIFDTTEIHQMRQRVLASHKMAAVGNLAAGVAHEINNPLAIAMANLDYIAEEFAALTPSLPPHSPLSEAIDDIGKAITKVQSSTDRVRRIIDDLRTFSDSAEGRADRVNLQRLVSWAIRRFDPHIYPGACRLSVDLQNVSPIWASEVAVVQIVWNLLENAFDAIADLPPDEQSVELTLRPAGEFTLLQVRDTGPGMSPEVARRAFEPFFTTKAVGKGVGLGLFVCQGLLEAMDGEIIVDSRPGEGTTVQVLFPALSGP